MRNLIELGIMLWHPQRRQNSRTALLDFDYREAPCGKDYPQMLLTVDDPRDDFGFHFRERYQSFS